MPFLFPFSFLFFAARYFYLFVIRHIFFCCHPGFSYVRSSIVSLQCKSWLHFMYISIIFHSESHLWMVQALILRPNDSHIKVDICFLIVNEWNEKKNNKKHIFRVFFFVCCMLFLVHSFIDATNGITANCNLIYYCRQIYFMITKSKYTKKDSEKSTESKRMLKKKIGT